MEKDWKVVAEVVAGWGEPIKASKPDLSSPKGDGVEHEAGVTSAVPM